MDTWDRESNTRIARATLWVEKQIAPDGYRSRRRRPGAGGGGITAKLVRVFSSDGGANPGDVATPVASCLYDAVTLYVPTSGIVAENPFSSPFSSEFGAQFTDWCGEPYTEKTDIWLAKTSPNDGPFHHEEEYFAIYEMGSYTPAGQEPRPLYVAKPVSEGGTSQLGMYRATSNVGFSGSDSTYAATITHIISAGNAGVGNTVTIENLYREAASSGAQLMIVEWFDDPTLKYLAQNVERTQKTMVEGITWNDGSGNILTHREYDWSYYEATPPPDLSEPTDTCP